MCTEVSRTLLGLRTHTTDPGVAKGFRLRGVEEVRPEVGAKVPGDDEHVTYPVEEVTPLARQPRTFPTPRVRVPPTSTFGGGNE